MASSRKARTSKKMARKQKKKIGFEMKGLYWNSRGLSDLAKH
jgi:hypothetical protein